MLERGPKNPEPNGALQIHYLAPAQYNATGRTLVDNLSIHKATNPRHNITTANHTAGEPVDSKLFILYARKVMARNDSSQLIPWVATAGRLGITTNTV